MDPHRPPATAELAHRLTDLAVGTVEAVEHHHLRGWRVPGVFAGHEVGADVRADVCFTLTHLAAAGVHAVATEAIDDVLVRLLGRVDGSATHTFFSYRIAETLLRHGGFDDDNPLVAALSGPQRDELVRAVDSSDWVELLDAGVLPRNYAGVLSRCALGQVRLGLADDERTLDRLVERLADLLGENPRGALDDSHDRVGRYDIYSGDVWLFVAPLADRLGRLWTEGLGHALRMVRTVGTRDGSAVPWGRSVGDLAAALTVELAAVAVADGHDPGHEAVWLRRAIDATDTLERAFAPDGVSTAHVDRSQDSYRGPERRLQLTFDLLGKVAEAAATLRRSTATGVGGPAPVAEAYPDGDRWLAFEVDRPTGVWAHRSPGAAWVVPFVGTTRSHYLPAPHQPGTWEVPVDRDLPCWTPLVTAGLQRHTAGGVPAAVEHDGGSVTATWVGFPASGRGLDGDDPGPPLAGTRTATLRVEGRSLVLEDRLQLDRPPRTVALAVPETSARPLRVEWQCESPHATTTVDVAGLHEWRTPTGQIDRVHQIDLDPATDLAYRARVTPHLRVATTEIDHHYGRSMFGPLTDRMVVRGAPFGWNAEPGLLLRDVDLVHMHWPEWVAFDDLDAHREIVDWLATADVPVVWTAHNLTPHAKQPEVYDPIYQLWARASAGVIHHSRWGMARMRERYDFGDGCRHAVIPHGHFGALWEAEGVPDRRHAEEALRLPPLPEGGVRIGVVGSPRAEKLVQVVLDAVATCQREDVQLVCWSLAGDERVPDDPRLVVTHPYRSVSAHAYATRVASCDVLALIFDPDGEMLGTGSAADATGLGIPALTSDWAYLAEALGDGAIPAGQTVESVAAAIDGLTPEVLAAARAGAQRRREEISWDRLAPAVEDLFERVVQDLP